MRLPLEEVSACAPIFYFHERETFFPCSIELLLKGSRLCRRDGKPFGPELWAQFRGRLGILQSNSLRSATRYDGRPLTACEDRYVKTVDLLARLLGLYPEDIRTGDGPLGPGSRDWVRSPGGRYDGRR